MNSVLFCRVSSREQEETGYSLPAQEKLLKSYADKLGYQSPKVFSISESASGKKQRQTFLEMLSYVEKHQIKVIICEKVDRLTRNFKDAVNIDDWLEEDEERQVHLVKDNLVLHKNSRSQEKLNWGIRILFAKNYIDNLSEEVKKGQKEKLAQGWLPCRSPLGYKSVGEKGHKIHILDETKAPLVRKMFEMYASGNYSLLRLTNKMYELGLRAPSGSQLVKSRVHQMLTDPFFIGKIKWNDSVYDGKHEPLVDEQTFLKIQKILKGNCHTKHYRHDYLFKGVILCNECNGLITWELQKGHIYGHCNHYRNCNQKVWVKEPKIIEQVTAGFEKLEIKNARLAEWLLKALKESHKDEITYYSATKEELDRRKEQITNRLDNLYDDKLDSKITEEFYERKFKQYSEELSTIDSSLNRHTQANINYLDLGINIFKLSQRAQEIFEKAENDDKRQLLRLVFKEIKLNEGVISYTYTSPFEILSRVVARTNSSKLLKMAKIADYTFEPVEQIDKSTQEDIFYSNRSDLLRD